MRRRSAVRATTGLFLLLVSSSCTSKPGDNTPTGPVFGGTLRVAVRDLSTLDPAKATGRGAMFVLSQIFRPLTAIDAANAATPSAATDWATSANGLRWDFHLRSATFHDGSKVTAAAFVDAFNRVALKATASDAAFQLEAVKGFRAAKVLGTAKKLDGVSAPNESTVRFDLEHPFAELPRFLAHPALVPLRPGAASSSTFGSAPVGNGPFRVSEPRSDTGVGLARFDGWTGQKPYLDGVKVELRSDAQTIWTDLNGGRLDVGEVPSDRIGDASRQFGNAGIKEFWAAFYYGLNLRLPAYNRVEVRRAISLAIDREALVRDVYTGTKSAALGIVPAGVPGARTQPCEFCGYDPPRARTLLNSVFKGRPPEMRIDHLDAGPSRDLARAVAAQLQDAGLKVALRAHSAAEYKKLLADGKQEIAELGWFSDVPSPDPFLAQQLRTGSTNNPSGFADKTFDQTIDRARAARDEPKRIAEYDAAQSRALALMPLVPLVFFRSRIAATPVVHGFRLDGAGIFDAAVVWLSSAK